MGSSDEGTPAKPSKPTSAQEAPPAVPSYPEWANHMQAYYGAGATPPFFASAVASPTPHPYLWGSQHPLMPPYGTPIPYPALYHPGGVYAHPNMAMAPSTSQVNVESDAKASEGKGHTSVKKSKGSSSGKKTASSSGNDGATQSSESGSDGSSDANDENNDQEFPASKKGSFDQMLANGNPAISLPATNLNIGMDLWNMSSAGPGSIKMQPNPTRVSPTGREGMMPEQWIQDERELKRQKRKQSNRESARRSRLRKQEELNSLYGPHVIPKPDCNGFTDHHEQARDDEGSSG
ncbi:unnamed protein product [Cuscuta campestris]|uniref:BZIP domain-containing protein n=1 Tax=Cuscuta campestris TaxID=132261 RepID=A0A484LFX6_9ASTE|nr:unnamed protein product [Cuscuta campestris]